jgi:hypothetical protein
MLGSCHHLANVSLKLFLSLWRPIAEIPRTKRHGVLHLPSYRCLHHVLEPSLDNQISSNPTPSLQNSRPSTPAPPLPDNLNQHLQLLQQLSRSPHNLHQNLLLHHRTHALQLQPANPPPQNHQPTPERSPTKDLPGVLNPLLGFHQFTLRSRIIGEDRRRQLRVEFAN